MQALPNYARQHTVSALLQDVNSILLVAFAFVLPLWIAPSYIIAGLICVFWLLQGNFKTGFNKIRGNKLVLAVVAYLLLHIVGLLWTSNLAEGPDKVARASLFLLVPVFMMVLNDENVEPVIWSFLASMILSCLFSFFIYFKVDPAHFKSTDDGIPIYFMFHIHYSVYLTFSIAFTLYYLLFDPKNRKWLKIVSSVVLPILIFDLLICDGRTGQVIFFVFLVITILWYFGRNWFRSMMILLIALPMIFVLAYKTVPPFNNRSQKAIAEIMEYRENKATSIGQRLVYAQNAYKVFLENPLIGVGTGDFEDELKHIHEQESPNIKFDVDPHNMFLLEIGQFGIVGIIVFLSIFYAQFRIALQSEVTIQKYLGFAAPIMFMLINLTDISLQLHFPTMLFILVSSILYRDYSGYAANIFADASLDR